MRENFCFKKSSKFSIVFRLWGKHFGFLAKIILLGCQNCFQVSRGFFWKMFFWKQIPWIVSFFLAFGRTFLDFRPKFCDRFVKTAFDVSSGDFWLDCFFYKNLWVFSPSSGCEENIVAFWRKNLRKFVKTASYEYKRNFGKFDFRRKNFYILFE